jgi:DNA-binding MarR family transcriptional regulator
MDLLDSNHWSDLHALLAELDRDIGALYTEAGIEGMRSRFVGPLIALHRFGPMTIRELAARRGVSHSAMSQTAAAMVKAGLVAGASGADARTRPVDLTTRSREIMPFLVAEWRATEAAVRQLDAELPYSLTRVTEDLRARLAARSFADRLRPVVP